MERLADAKTPNTVLLYLKGIQFPAHKQDLVHAARRNQAPNDIVAALGQLPIHQFENEQALIDAYPHMGG